MKRRRRWLHPLGAVTLDEVKAKLAKEARGPWTLRWVDGLQVLEWQGTVYVPGTHENATLTISSPNEIVNFPTLTDLLFPENVGDAGGPW